MEIELRVVNHPKPPKKQKKQKKAKKKTCFGDYLDLGMFRLGWKALFFFLVSLFFSGFFFFGCFFGFLIP
jgi:hypothetical protein